MIWFRFYGNSEEVDNLYSHKNVLIDNVTYSYNRYNDSIQAVVINVQHDINLYDHWIRFV